VPKKGRERRLHKALLRSMTQQVGLLSVKA